MAEIIDLEQRQKALDPEKSFLVQAPAGSGKTTIAKKIKKETATQKVASIVIYILLLFFLQRHLQ